MSHPNRLTRADLVRDAQGNILTEDELAAPSFATVLEQNRQALGAAPPDPVADPPPDAPGTPPAAAPPRGWRRLTARIGPRNGRIIGAVAVLLLGIILLRPLLWGPADPGAESAMVPDTRSPTPTQPTPTAAAALAVRFDPHDPATATQLAPGTPFSPTLRLDGGWVGGVIPDRAEPVWALQEAVPGVAVAALPRMATPTPAPVVVIQERVVTPPGVVPPPAGAERAATPVPPPPDPTGPTRTPWPIIPSDAARHLLKPGG